MRSPKVLRFGIKAVAPYNRETRVPYGVSEVVASGGLELAGEMVSLHGGGNRYSYDAAHGFIEPKMSITTKEFPSWLYTLMLGAAPETTDVKDSGIVRNIMNRKGTSLQSDDAITGVTVTTNANLKFGRYTVVATSATTIDIYAATDVDAGEGAKASFLALFDDQLKITKSSLDLQDGKNLEIATLGVTLEVAASVSGVTQGDSFTFDIVPKADYFREVTIGKNTDGFPVFGMYAISENIKGSALCLIDCFKCKANGLPMAFNEKSWGESELSIMPLIDGDLGVASITDLIRNK